MTISATPRGARSLRLSAVQLPTSTGTEEDRARRHSDCLENGIEPKPALKRLYGRTVNPETVEDHEHGQSSSTSTSSSSVKQDHHQKDYAPVRPIEIPAPHLKKAIPQSVSLHADENMFKPRKERQKVFAGRRRKVGEGVPSLVQMCQSVLLRTTPPQFNSVGFSISIFHELTKMRFRSMQTKRRTDGHGGKFMKNEKDTAKLGMLTSRIGKAHTGTNLGRQTMVIDMTHTRVKSKSFFNTVKETKIKMTPTPSAIQLPQIRKNAQTDHHQKDYAPVRPIGIPAPHLKKAIPQSVSLHADENMFKPRKERQKVFAGRLRKIGEGVPSLVQMCQSVLVANVDSELKKR
ncbi:hypothetical protein CAEBREN_00220 [Caenorhabditis brenneri]|uniref:Uncharacterized protein n=1 Tax=Caenorhabditis brenneri TaxID=135651 RepID=G0P9U7_CAEBE|nr:hypothetical protein CAEBREN_00220 [Caenorhabditis brenneri]